MRDRKWIENIPAPIVVEREEDISESFKSPLKSTLISIPLCNACKKWHDGREPDQCRQYEHIPDELRSCKTYECRYAELSEEYWTYPAVLECKEKWEKGKLKDIF